MKPYLEDADVQLYHGDSLSVLRPHDAGSQWNHSGGVYGRYDTLTTGWRPTCGHGNKIGSGCYPLPQAACVILDPFIGSGTTALVARKLGRRCIGIDLNADYLEMASRRLAQQSLFATEVA